VDPKTNPANYIQNPVLRAATKLMYGALHAWLLIFPKTLCCDWSGDSVPVLSSLLDARVAYVVAPFILLAFFTIKAFFSSR
jgi:hypothetical protein